MSATEPRIAPKRRVFLAVWPAPAVRAQLLALTGDLREQSGGRMTRPDNVHMTLAFLGALSDPEIEAVRGRAREVVFAAFAISMDRVQYRPRRRMVWLAANRPPAALLALVDGLSEALRRSGFQLERRAFHAHVTLIRKARRRPRLAAPSIVWPVTEFTLTESTLSPAGSEYRTLDRWPCLGGQSADMK